MEKTKKFDSLDQAIKALENKEIEVKSYTSYEESRKSVSVLQRAHNIFWFTFGGCQLEFSSIVINKRYYIMIKREMIHGDNEIFLLVKE